MSISSISSSLTTSTSTSSSSATSSSSDLDTEDFLKLLVQQLQNQNPLEPTDTDQILSQMVSFASYNQQAESNDTLSQIATSLSSISSALDITA